MGSPKLPPFLLLLTLTTILPNVTSKTYWRDIEGLKQLKHSIDQNSIPQGSCLSSWDFNYDPCDSLFSSKFTCGFTCSTFHPHKPDTDTDTDTDNKKITRVTELALDSAGYSTLSLSSRTFSNLPLLTSLDLSNNNFSGPIPTTLSSLPHLRRLTLSRNLFSGPIPDSLSQLSQLEELILDNNALEGPIPKTLSGLKSLQRLELQGNKITGEFPDSLSQLSSLSFLNCGENSLNGEFPQNLPSSLIEVSLRGNNLEGSLPSESVIKLQGLQVLDLSQNRFTGSVPASWFTHPSLQQLSLSTNNLTSLQVPTNLGTESGLIAVDLSGNNLSGLLPFFLGLMPKLSALSLENNSFTGMIPTQYALKTVFPQAGVAPFERLLLGGNYLFGPIPDPFMKMDPETAHVNLVDNCLFVCPDNLFFCQGGDQKSLVECRDNIGPVIP